MVSKIQGNGVVDTAAGQEAPDCHMPAPAWAAGSLRQDRQTAADEEGALWWICLPVGKHEWHSCTAAGQDIYVATIYVPVGMNLCICIC